CAISLFFFQAEDGIRDRNVTGVQTCALPILKPGERMAPFSERCSISGGSSATGQTLLIRPSAITTAWSSRNSWPVKIRPWVNAYILTPDFKKYCPEQGARAGITITDL